MRNLFLKRYRSPKIREKKIKVSLLSFQIFNNLKGDYLSMYCGQCVASPGRDACPGCIIPQGCDSKSC